ncbi:MAG: GDSL-type esterase/lipase family protein, partial [Acidobacteriota bacterium]|nr:GDSL-type esterase/lipase family protein [Acidobacteriota bacterium]
IWTIRTDGSDLTKIHARTMEMEIAGHEFWSADGKTIWYDLQTPRGEDFWVAGYRIDTQERTWYHLDRNEWSVHFNVSPDGKLFAGDGGDSEMVAHAKDGKWIYLFQPEIVPNHGVKPPGGLIKVGVLKSEKLVNMSKHDYALEPNVSFTPDMKWIVFRSNMFGPTQVFAVEIKKSAAPTPRTSLKFDFGSGAAGPGFTKVLPTTMYTSDAGYGFEEVSETKPPFYFSVKVPEGNYRVTATLGDPNAASTTTVKAELRRLMLENVHTAPGKFETRSFIVNVRTPTISTGGEVRLKPREKTLEAWAWDEKLTLEFIGAHPAVRTLEIEKVENLPTVFIAGDSTSTDQPREPFNSWGQMLTRFFKPGIAIANHGESGESLRSFLGENRWSKLMSVIQAGDTVLIQMGHNDQKDKSEGAGAFTTYKTDLKRFVADVRQHGATPVLITPMHRLTFGPDGKIANSLGDFPEAVRQTAKEENVALIDLHAMSKPFYEALGPRDAHKAFAGSDTTHHSDYGSYELAKCVVEGLRRTHLPIAEFLVDGVPPFNPAHPDPFAKFDIPAEPTAAAQRPYGN